MNKKNIKQTIVENWFAIDYFLLGNVANKVLEESDLNKYISSKTALLSNVMDIHVFSGYEKEVFPYKETTEMFDYIGDKIDQLKEDVKTELTRKSVLKSIKLESTELLKGNESDKETVIKNIVHEKFRNSVLDEMLLRECLEQIDKDKLSESTFKVLIDAHKILRRDLVNLVK